MAKDGDKDPRLGDENFRRRKGRASRPKGAKKTAKRAEERRRQADRTGGPIRASKSKRRRRSPGGN